MRPSWVEIVTDLLPEVQTGGPDHSYTPYMTARNDPRVVSEWIEAVWKLGGTDLLLTADSPPLARVDGLYGPLNERLITRDDTEMIVKRILTPDLYNVFVESLAGRLLVHLAGARPHPRQRLRAAGHTGRLAAHHPARHPHAWTSSVFRRSQPSSPNEPSGLVLVDGPHRIRQVDDARRR